MKRHFLSQTFMSTAVVMLVIITCAVETDIFLPSFPALKDYFATTERKIQMLISMNFLGLCLACPLYGPLADAYGRRPILLFGMCLFALSSIACTLVNTLESMLFWRFIQGLGSSVAFVVPRTIVRDIYDREHAAKILGIYGSLVTFVMSFAPIFGNYLYLVFSWRANFIFVAVLSVISFLSAAVFVYESLHKEKRLIMHGPTILYGYKKILTTPKAMANLYLLCSVSGAYFVYIANLSLLFVDHLNVNKEHYGYYQGVILLVFALVSFNAGWFIKKLGINHTRMLGMKITMLGSVLFLGVALWARDNPLLITLAMSIFTGGFALNIGIISGDYLDVYPEIRGIASSLGGTVTLLAMLVLITFAAFLFNGTIVPVAGIVFFFGVTSLMVMVWLHREDASLD